MLVGFYPTKFSLLTWISKSEIVSGSNADLEGILFKIFKSDNMKEINAQISDYGEPRKASAECQSHCDDRVMYDQVSHWWALQGVMLESRAQNAGITRSKLQYTELLLSK